MEMSKIIEKARAYQFEDTDGLVNLGAILQELDAEIDFQIAQKEAALSLPGANDALNRMRKAAKRGMGCHLFAEMIASVEVTIVGQTWAEADSREASTNPSLSGKEIFI